jgi:NitT/TauT family transport system ATP-binding protein
MTEAAAKADSPFAADDDLPDGAEGVVAPSTRPAPVPPEHPQGRAVALERLSYRVTNPESGKQLTILDSINLRFDAGELVCLLGPSGSGKTTILHLVAGLVRPSEGVVRCADAVVTGPGPDRAVVFQEASLFPWLTLQDNIEFPLKLAGMSKGERAARSEELLRLVHLWRFRRAFPHELSGGMRQRGAIARALATDPAVLLMDEPFAALDAQTREILHAEVERIFRATRKTILFVTHNVREAVRLADRVVLLGTRPGRVLHEVRIDLPRPRGANDEHLSVFTKDLARRIAGEVDKIAREEADESAEIEDYASLVDPGGKPVDPGRDLGGGI